MEARDIILNLYNHRSTTSSCAYNVHEQNRAIRSAEQQVSIANDTVKSATSKLTTRVAALEVAVDNYFGRLHELKPSSSAAHNQISAPTNSLARSSQSQSASASESRPSEVSSAASSSNSVGSVLVSLKSNVGVIYSLVNKKPK